MSLTARTRANTLAKAERTRKKRSGVAYGLGFSRPHDGTFVPDAGPGLVPHADFVLGIKCAQAPPLY